MLFYEMLTGELPVGHFDPPSRKAGSQLRLDEIVLRALCKEPSRRYQQAREVRNDLLSMASETSYSAKFSKRNWGRLHELLLSVVSIALFTGGAGSAVESQWHLNYARHHAINPREDYEQAWFYLSLTCALWLLSVVLCRINISRPERWCDLSIAQWLAAPILQAGYLLLGLALSLFPAVWICLLAAMPGLVDIEHCEMFGRLFGESDRSTLLTPYWSANFATAALSSAGWTALVAWVFWRWPTVVRLVFHPTSTKGARSVAIYFTLLAVIVLLPLGVALLYLSQRIR